VGNLFAGILLVIIGTVSIVLKHIHIRNSDTDIYGQEAVLIGSVFILFGLGFFYLYLRTKKKTG